MHLWKLPPFNSTTLLRRATEGVWVPISIEKVQVDSFSHQRADLSAVSRVTIWR
jgi:hypothetical protein